MEFLLDSSIQIISKSYYFFACCPEKSFGFRCSLPLENDLDFAKKIRLYYGKISLFSKDFYEYAFLTSKYVFFGTAIQKGNYFLKKYTPVIAPSV
jgi:hypothetical protein